MKLVTYNPARSLAESFLNDAWNSWPSFDNIEAQFEPRVDVLHEESAVHVNVELPGVKKEDLHVKVENNVLSISGEKKVGSGEKHWLRERGYGKFSRSFRLSDDVDGNKIKARFEDGVLQLEIARKESSLPREVKIS